MRELKFRAFIDGEMVILPFAALQYFDFEGSYVLSFAVDGYDGFWGHEHYESATKRKCKGAPIMQFTGLKDKNGKEIYESDIVLWDERPAVIEYDVRMAGYYAMWKGEGVQFHNMQQINPEHGGLLHISVIGNIHEHPHLLTPSQKGDVIISHES